MYECSTTILYFIFFMSDIPVCYIAGVGDWYDMEKQHTLKMEKQLSIFIHTGKTFVTNNKECMWWCVKMAHAQW